MTDIKTLVESKIDDLKKDRGRAERDVARAQERVATIEQEILDARVSLCQLTQGVSAKVAREIVTETRRRAPTRVTEDEARDWITALGGAEFTRGDMIKGLGLSPHSSTTVIRLLGNFLAEGFVTVVQRGSFGRARAWKYKQA